MRSNNFFALIYFTLCASALAGTPPNPSPTSPQTWQLLPGQDCKGQDLSSKSAPSAEACCGICEGTQGCTAFAFWSGTCYLKASCEDKIAKGDTTVGIIGAGPSPGPAPSGSLWCPSAGDLVAAWGSVQLQDQGWTVLGGGGAATKTAFNLNGGYVEFDIDFSGVNTGVNANIYTISPSGIGGGYQPSNYCDGAGVKPWCLEVDWIESNGNCGGATTLHTKPGPGSNGCTAWGCRASYHYGGRSSFHMRVEYGADGSWTTIRDGQTINAGSLSPQPGGADWNVIKSAHEQTGAVIYSSEWTGWVPVEDCGTSGDLSGSHFSVKNLTIKGAVVQGPTPRACSAPAPPPPSLSPRPPPPLPPSPSPSPSSVAYCPDPAKDFQEEVEGPPGQVTWTSSGWHIQGQRRVSSKASFDLKGGYIEWDMDLSKSHGGVNSNFYVTFPRKPNCGIGCYCDSGATGGCAEIDLTENNGGCFQASTWHDDPNGGDKSGHGGSGGISGGVVHMKATYSQDGNTVNVQVGSNHYSGSGEASNMDSFGAVIYSSQWVGWVPGNCGGDGNLQASSFTVSNIKIQGTVKQGPGPKRCPTTPSREAMNIIV